MISYCFVGDAPVTGKLIEKGISNHATKAYEFSHFFLVSPPTNLLTHVGFYHLPCLDPRFNNMTIPKINQKTSTRQRKFVDNTCEADIVSPEISNG